jgi:hypothetical protein
MSPPHVVSTTSVSIATSEIVVVSASVSVDVLVIVVSVVVVLDSVVAVVVVVALVVVVVHWASLLVLICCAFGTVLHETVVIPITTAIAEIINLFFKDIGLFLSIIHLLACHGKNKMAVFLLQL